MIRTATRFDAALSKDNINHDDEGKTAFDLARDGPVREALINGGVATD